MIGPNAYNASFYNAAMPRLADQQTMADAAAADTRDAADFERILNGPAPHVTTTPAPAAAEEGPSFIGFIKGVIDVINPLQHIPVVSAIYRHLTGDEMNPVARLAGDALYGGPLGAALAVADIAYETATGRDVGAAVIASLGPKENPPANENQIALNLNDQITPAAGLAAADIIWDEPTAISRLSSAPPLPHQGTNGLEPVSTPTPSPVLLAKDSVIPAFKPLTASKVDSTIVLHPQEAPAAASRMDVAPELIAAKMMDALDKYRQMKEGQLGTMVSAVY